MNTSPQLVCPALLRRTRDGWVLLGSRCRDCGEHGFPAQSGCAHCGSTRIAACELGERGSLWSWTVQGFLPKPPYDGGEDAAEFRPYGVGYVEMPCGLKVESRLTSADPRVLRIGMPMQLCLEPYRRAADGSAVHSFAFAPLEPQA